MTSEKTEIGALRRIARIAIDQRTVYADAAKMADAADLKTRLSGLAARREPLIADFNARISELGGDIAEHHTMTGAAHDVLVKARDLTGGGDKAAIDEVLKGEDALIKDIDDVLGSTTFQTANAAKLRELRSTVDEERRDLNEWRTRLAS